MTAGIISGILGLAVPLITWLLNRANASAEQKKAFFEWVKKSGEDFGSVKLKKYADEQLAWFASNPFVETP